MFYFDSQTKGISGTDFSVLITGETGTGKDVLAEVIHHGSSRDQGPFVKVNCGALPETLLEFEFFGHQRGAFAGATDTKPGRFKLAHKDTLFLTEIGDLPLILQVKLLSFAGQGSRRRLFTGTLFAYLHKFQKNFKRGQAPEQLKGQGAPAGGLVRNRKREDPERPGSEPGKKQKAAEALGWARSTLWCKMKQYGLNI